jgi:hypothetical protein
MDPIFRRSSVLYLSHLMTYSVLMGRFLVTRDWTAFEFIPLFMPVWLASSVLFSEHDESYAFLRTLPVTDRAVVGTKFTLILSSATVQWLAMLAVAVLRSGDGVVSPATPVYLTLVCACGLLAAGALQVAIWRYGVSVMKPVILTFMALGIVWVVIHMLSVKRLAGWSALSQTAALEWLGGAPWVSSALVMALAMTAFYGLMRAGVSVKAASEAHL